MSPLIKSLEQSCKESSVNRRETKNKRKRKRTRRRKWGYIPI
jgi:hypothetical protein